jgi:hypothetical protein
MRLSIRIQAADSSLGIGRPSDARSHFNRKAGFHEAQNKTNIKASRSFAELDLPRGCVVLLIFDAPIPYFNYRLGGAQCELAAVSEVNI